MKHKILGYLFLVAAAIVVVGGVYLWQNPRIVKAPATEDETKGWQTYSSTEYGFELKYPEDWKTANDVAAGEPRFSIYKTGDAPLSHHVNATQVSIFPKGLGTEGAGGRNKQISADMTGAEEKTVVEFSTTNGDPFAYYIGFKTIPSSWESYGYVWGSAGVNNYSVSEECATPCEGYPSVSVNGDVDKTDMAIVKEILATFKFTDEKAWKIYSNNNLGFSIQYPPGTVLSEEFNDRYNRYVGFNKSNKPYFNVRIESDINSEMGVKYGKYDSIVVATNIKIGGQTGYKAISETGYGDAGQQGLPFVEFGVRYQGDIYHITFSGDAVVSEEEQNILSSFKFTR